MNKVLLNIARRCVRIVYLSVPTHQHYLLMILAGVMESLERAVNRMDYDRDR